MRIQTCILLFLAISLTSFNKPEFLNGKGPGESEPGKSGPRESISLEGKWAFRIDSLDEGITAQWHLEVLEGSIKLPGSMTESGLGYEVELGTEWTAGLSDSSYYKEKRYERYRQADNIKIPFWLQPVKYYSGAAWYQKEIFLPEDWEGENIVLILERCHWESRVYHQ